MLPEWFEGIYEEASNRSILMKMMGGMSDLLQARDFKTLDEILAAADVTRLTPTIMVGLCRYPIPAKPFLQNWVPFLKRVDAELRSRDHPEVDRVMMGLTKYYQESDSVVPRFSEFPETVDGDVSPAFVELVSCVHPDHPYNSATAALLCRQAYDLGRSETPDITGKLARAVDRLTTALHKLCSPVPGTKGMGPKDRADRLHAEMERRIAIGRKAIETSLTD